MAKPCTINYTSPDGTEYQNLTEEEFFALLASGEFEKLVDEGFLPPIPPVDITETEREGAKEKLLGMYKTLTKNAQSNPEFLKRLEDAPLSYQAIGNDQTRAEAIEYIKKNGFGVALDDVLSGKIKDGRLNTAVAYYLYSTMHNELITAVKEGNTALANELQDVKYQIVETVGNRLRQAGQETQAASFFAKDLTDAQTANFIYEKAMKRANEKVKQKMRGKAEKDIEKARQQMREGEEEFEAAVNEKFGGEKPRKSKLSPKKQARKEQLRNKFMAKFRDVTTAAAELLDPELYEYGALLIEEGYKDFASFSKKALRDFGKKAKPILTKLYKGSAKRAVEDGVLSESEIDTDEKISKFLAEQLTDKGVEALIRKNLGEKLTEIAKRYYHAVEELKTPQGLSQKIIEEIGGDITLTEEDALRVAKWIDERYNKMVVERVKKALEQQVKARIKSEEQAKSKEQPKPKTPFADKAVNSILSGVITADEFMDIYGRYYGINEYTAADTEFVSNKVEQINKTNLDYRKNELTYDVMKYFVDKNPLAVIDALNAAWYGSVLSGVGTQDVNITFGVEALGYAFAENLTTAVMDSAEAIDTKGKRLNLERLKTTWYGYLLGLGRLMYDGMPIKRDDTTFIWSAAKNFMLGTRNAAAYAYKRGMGSFEEGASQLEFEARKDVDFTRLSKATQSVNWLSRIKDWAKIKPLQYLNALKWISSRPLAAADLFFTGIIQNFEVVPLVETHLRNTPNPDGTTRTEKQIRDEMQKILMPNDTDVQEARKKAINERMEFDIEIKEQDGKFVIYDEGKPINKNFETKSEAEQYAKENVAPKGIRFNRDVIEFMNQRIPEQQFKDANNLARDFVGTGTPKGSVGVAYNFLNYAKEYLDKKSRDRGKFAQSSVFVINKVVLPAFIKFPLNFINMTIDYSPVAYLRRYSKTGTIMGGMFGDKYARDIDNERLKARMTLKATIGTVAFIMSMASLIKLWDDEEDDTDAKKAQKREERYQKWLKLGGDPKIKAENPMFSEPEDGEVMGSLAFLPAEKKKFLLEAGLAQEFSQYDAKSGRWKSFIADRQALPKQFAGTFNAYRKFIWSDPTLSTKTELEMSKFSTYLANAFGATFEQYLQLSSLKGTQRLLSSPAFQQGGGWTEKLFDFSLNAITQPLQPLNPAFVVQSSKYIDGVAREYPTISKMGAFDYTVHIAKQNLVPFGRVFFKGKVKYDQFGDPIPEVPAEKQGYLSQKYSQEFLDKYPNKKLQFFLFENGSFEVKQPPRNLYYYPNQPTEGDILYEFLTDDERTDVGIAAAKLYKAKLLEQMDELQDIANKESKKGFNIEKPTYETKFNEKLGEIYQDAFKEAFEEFVHTKNGKTKEEKFPRKYKKK